MLFSNFEKEKFLNFWNVSIKLTNNIDTTLFSLITLTIFIISLLSWLALRTLKEGKKALKEIIKDRS